MKRFILTGGSDGLGEAFGHLCSTKGIEIICLSRSKPSYKATHVITDLQDEQSIVNAVAHIKQNHASFDALINCAGVISLEKANAISFNELKRVFEINTIAPIFLTSQLFELIIQNQADVLNVGSTVGTKAYQDQCAYGSSKWAVRGFSQNLQLQLKNTSSRVIQFNPGGFRSELVQKHTGQEMDMQKYMDPEELAKLMLFILELPKSMEVSEILINRK